MGDIILKDWVLALITILTVPILFYLYFYTVKRKTISNTLLSLLFPSGSKETHEFLSDKLAGSFFPAFLIHASIAIMTEEFSIYHNRRLHFHLKKTSE